MEINFKKNKINTEKVLFRNWKKLDPDTFNDKLLMLDDILPYDSNDLSEFLSSFEPNNHGHIK